MIGSIWRTRRAGHSMARREWRPLLGPCSAAVVLLVAGMVFAATKIQVRIAYRDADEAAVRVVWQSQCPDITLADGVRCVIGSSEDSGRVHFHRFHLADATRIQSALDSIGVFDRDSIQVVVPEME